jgi:parallel beta-helix repeat protein
LAHQIQYLSLAVRFALFAGVAVCAQLAAPAWAGVIYVKADATGTKTGLSWADAHTDLQAGLAAAEWGDEIWVAQGTYKPTTGTLRTVSFELEAGVGLYGGFAGAETEREQRNWEANPTVLSGDIGTTATTDNSYHVVVGESPAVLDGFTITEGNANGSGSFDQGGGMYNYYCSPTVANCTFSGNAAYIGGGMYNDWSSAIVTNCTFTGNTARYGGGMRNYGFLTVTNCTFSGNTTTGIGGGGGMYMSDSPAISNCTFSDNTAGQYGGGGIYNAGSSSKPTVTNCTFSGNTASSTYGTKGGGGMYNENCSPTMTNCTFSGNTASGTSGTRGGGGMYNYHNSPTVTNCIFWDNTALLGAEIYNDSATTPTFSHCDIKGSGGSGASWDTALGKDGGGNITSDPRFVAQATPAGPDGLWRTNDDGLRLQSDSPCIGAADPAVAPATDILGLPRSFPPDIGAYEFSSGGGSYTLTYNAGAGGSITGTTPQTVASGADGSEVTAVPNAGYHFVQWSDGVKTASRTDTNVTADITVTASFAINTYTLTYTAGAGGSITGTTPQAVAPGANGSQVTAVPNTGYHFVQWSDGVKTASRTDTNVTANISVTASFAINTYTLTYCAGPGGSISGTTPQTVDYGASGTPVTAVAATGYHFVKWSDNVMTESRTDTSVTRNINVTAVFGSAEGVIHVKADATGAMDGHSWADAFTDLQAGLAAAEWGDEIWVARGTYKPTSGTLRTASFVLQAGVALYGGFAGTEAERSQRDWEANATKLSGDIGTAGSATDNSYHVVVGAYLTVLDGFTITGGNANGSGSFHQGGGMYNEDCSPTVANCTFSGNTAGDGGGMYNASGSPTVTNCTFSGNTTSSGDGGGMCNYGGSPIVTNCTFSGNTTSSGDGGGMCNYGSSPTVTNCTFSGNAARGDYGYGYGGGMYNSGGSPTVTNCTFSGNTAGWDGGGGGMYSGSATVTNCTFSGNTAGHGGGVSGGQTFTNCTFSDNTADDGGGAGGGQTFINCTFSGNKASEYGGGVSGGQTFTNCTFSDNTASDSGGGMYSGSATVTNCIFWDNSASLGPEIFKSSGSTPIFRHCDIKGSGGSGSLWNPALGADGGGNIMSDPRFVAPGTPAGPDRLWRTSDDGLRLQSNSPCIGAANPAVAPGTDILGLPRGSAPDMGAYEFYIMPPASANLAWLLFR